MIAKAQYNFSVGLAEGWEQDAPESLHRFVDETEQKLMMIAELSDSDFVSIDSFSIDFNVVVAMKDIKPAEKLDSDFWLEVAKGNFKE